MAFYPPGYSPNHGGPRSSTRGVVIHSTRGGQPPGPEFEWTNQWFSQTASQVSAHAVVSQAGEITYPVADDLVAWHARYYNGSWLGIEFEQGRVTDEYTEVQIAAGAGLVRAWCDAYSIPIDRDHIAGHEEIPPGIEDVKSDPGILFPWDHFMAMVSGTIDIPPVIPDPIPPSPVGSDVVPWWMFMVATAMGVGAISLIASLPRR